MIKEKHDNSHPFPIRELSARTQVNTVTLRAWERRYGLLKPQRSAKGHRLYSDQDVATIEKILSLVARGVPLGKLKPLLDTDISALSEGYESENWQSSIAELLVAIESFSVTKVEHLLQHFFAHYPAPICRERLMEPVFAALAQINDNGATLGFAENELIRYSLMRLNSKVKHKKQPLSVILLPGDQTPIWCLALMALELADMKFSVHLFTRAFTLAGGIELAGKFNDAYTVFYQDGTWKTNEQESVVAALLENDKLFLCGTAPMLTPFNEDDRVFGDVRSSIDGLLKRAAIQG